MNISLNNIIIKHIIFWALFLLLWSLHDLSYNEDILEILKNNVFTFIPYVILVYFNLYVLIPIYLLKKRFANYILLLILSITLVTFVASYYHSFYFRIINVLPTAEFFTSIRGKIAIVTEVILSLCLSMTLFLIDEWYRKDQSFKEIKQKQLETELNLLKNQINPHFLFNSLNSIYVMLSKNLNDGKRMLLQFSEILSHQLYEANKKSIELDREFENLTNYISIEKVRHEDLVTVKYTFPADHKQLTISPMLLMPIVENAFKHGQSSNGYWINIESSIEHDSNLSFRVENSVSGKNNSKLYLENSGIGLSNVKRRLELIYPNRHLFKVERQDSKFTVFLKIQLNENEMFNS